MPKYHIVVSGHQCGPYEPHELWAQGLSPGSLVWTEAMADWQEARNVPDLAPMFRQALVPPAPQYAPPAQYPQQPIAAPPAYASPPPASHPQQGQYPQPGQYAQPMQYAPPGQYPQPGGYGYPGQPQVNLVHVPVPYVPAKSVGVAFLLTFFFGPLGMLYSTVPGALIMICISFVAAIFTAGFSVPFTWIGCIIWGCVAASNSNGRMAAQVRRH